jgi:hypothetical protein
MSRSLLLSVTTTVICGMTLLAGCGSSPAADPASSAASPSSATTSPATAGDADVALTVALGAQELPAAATGLAQKSDGLLNHVPRTDARVFSSADGKSLLEIDVVVDVNRGAAASDYGVYNRAAEKQVTVPASSTPSIGAMVANEFVGTDTSGRSVVSLSFVEGPVIGVLTMLSTSSAVNPAVVEAVARVQVQKIDAAKL